MPPPWSFEGPSHPQEEGRLINISLGYEILPLCMGPTKLCINVSRQTWAFILPPKRNFHTLLGLFTALSFYENHVNTTKTLGKGQKLVCKGFTYKDFKYTPVYWNRCQAKSGKLMFMANYTIVDWRPHDMWVSKAMVFPVVMYGCESWTVKKTEHQRIDAFELWCWRRLLRVTWTTKRSNQSILKEISSGCSLEGLMLKLKLHYFGHLMRRIDSLENTLMLGGIGGRRKRG